jgi:hypothetical protein
VYPDVDPLCFSRMDLCLSPILAVLLLWVVPCNHLTSLPHVRSKALSEFTNYLQTYVLSFLFIATMYTRRPSVRAVHVRSCFTVFCVRSNGTSATHTALPCARQPQLLSHFVSRVVLRRVLYCIPECTGSYFWENRLKVLQSGGKLSEVQIST